MVMFVLMLYIGDIAQCGQPNVSLLVGAYN